MVTGAVHAFVVVLHAFFVALHAFVGAAETVGKVATMVWLA